MYLLYCNMFIFMLLASYLNPACSMRTVKNTTSLRDVASSRLNVSHIYILIIACHLGVHRGRTQYGCSVGFGEEDAMRWDLLEVGLSFFCALYGQKQGTPMEDARYTLYTKTKARPRLRNLPPNSANLLLHAQRAHLQMTLWKAADQHSPPDIDISNFGWEMKAGVLSPCIDPGPTGPPALMDVISCHRQAAGKHVQRSAAVRRKVSPARFTAYVNPGTNAAIPPRGRSKWMMRTKTTASCRSVKLWMLTVLLIESECNKQHSFIAFIIVISFHLCNRSIQ